MRVKAAGALLCLIIILLASTFPVTSAATPALPPFSIYGKPSPPSPNPILNGSGEYWGPYISDVYITWFTTSEAAMEALVNGYIQYDDYGVSNIQEYNQLVAYAATGQVGLNVTAYNGFYFIGFKYNSYPFNNTFFRLGIQRLINYRQVASSLYNGILGVASPYYFLPTLYGEYFSAAQAQAYETYGGANISAAIQDFERAGLVYHASAGYWSYPNGTKVNLIVYVPTTDEDLERSILSTLVANAASINLSISLVTVNTDTLVYSLLPSQSAEMYIVSIGFGPPAEPSYVYSFLGPSPINQVFIHYYNATLWRLLNQLYNSPTQSAAQANANAVGVYLQETVPVVVLAWITAIIPVSLVGWRGYVFQTQVGYVFPGNMHPAGASFGGLYRYADSFPPSDLNIYTQVSGADYAVLYMMWLTPMQLSYNTSQIFPWAVYNWSITPSSGVMPNGHHYNGSVITLYFLHNIVWQDGAPLTAVDLNFTIWYFDAGGFSANPYNTFESVIDYAPGVEINLTATAQNPSSEWFDSIPDLAGTYVPPSDPYTIYIYMNSTSIFNLERPFPALWTMPILPEHVFYNISETTYATEPPSDYLAQQVMAGPYMLQSYSLTDNYVNLLYFPSYFLANPYSNTYTVSRGATLNFTVNVTVYGDSVTQTASGYTAVFDKIENGVGYLYVLNTSTLTPIAVYPLANLGGGLYGAAINTQNLTLGQYYLVAQVNWTGKPYYYYTGSGPTYRNQYYYHVYAVLNVTPPTTTTTTTPKTTTIPTTTATTPTQTTPTTTQIVGKTTSPTTAYVVVGVLVAAIVVVVAVVASRRTPK